jgi:hypothetical protein
MGRRYSATGGDENFISSLNQDTFNTTLHTLFTWLEYLKLDVIELVYKIFLLF